MNISIEATLSYLSHLMDHLAGEKYLKITHQGMISNFKVMPTGMVHLIEDNNVMDWQPETDELLNLVIMEASISGGSILVRQTEAREFPFMGKILAMDVLMAGKFSPKGIRPLKAEQLQTIYGKAPEMTVIEGMPDFHRLKDARANQYKQAS